MSNRAKTMLMSFFDYGVCLFLELLCLIVFSVLFKYSWGNILYSVFFCVVMFGMLYSRTHRAAKNDMLHKVERPTYEGLIMVLPLAILNFVLALGFTLIQTGLIPVGDIVIETVYSFPENEPRVAMDVLLIEVITPIIRVWFAALTGFMRVGTNAALLFIMPVLNLVAGLLGYIAGKKKFFLSDHIFVAKEKVKEKFNE